MAGRVSAKEQAEAAQARAWLQNLLGLEVEDDFFAALGDGVLLCSIVNTIKPGTIPKVNPSGRAKKFPPKKMENINAFILGARKLGMLKSHLFELPEFLEKKRQDRLVNTLLHLEKLAIKAGIDRSKGSNILAFQNELDAADKAKEAALAAKQAEEDKKREEEIAARAAQDLKDREAGKIAEEEYRARQQKMQEEREQRERERQEKIKKDKEDIERRMKERREAAANLKPPTSSSGGTGSAPASPQIGRTASPARSASPSAGPPRMLYGVDALLAWAQQCTSGYKGVDVQDFTKSWKDGLAFCALMHYHAKGEIDFAACESKTPAQRLELAFDVGAKLGAPPLLDPEDVWDIPVPDRRSMITYLGVIYKAFKG